MKNEPNYYAIIPANVRYDKKIIPHAKLLYGEITALCNKEGYCWATNDYFSKLYGKSKTSISTWIKSLIDNGYIHSKIIYKDGTKEIFKRYLTILKDPIKENLNTPIKENLKDNITNINNTDINTYNNTAIAEKEEPQCLLKNIESAYHSKYGTFGDNKEYAKQVGCIKRAVKMATAKMPEDPEGFIQSMIKTHWELKQTDKWFKDKPFLPSILSSCWNQIEEYLRKSSALDTFELED